MSDSKPISTDERTQRSASFGAVAAAYQRFRPGPPAASIDWMIESGPAVVIDLGAGTGAMTRDLVSRVDHVIAVEPDDQMRAVLTDSLPAVTALKGTGEDMPIDDASVDGVLASSSWHWMDPVRAIAEAARILRPGGTLGAVWTGPDPDGEFLAAAQAVMQTMSAATSDGAGEADIDSDLADTVTDAPNRVDPTLHIPTGSPFSQPEHRVETWDIALTADELIGLLGTFSWIITLDEARRTHIIAEARRVLRDGLGIDGEVTVDVQYRAEAWRCYRA